MQRFSAGGRASDSAARDSDSAIQLFPTSAGNGAGAAFDLRGITRKGDKSEVQKAELRRMRFANDQSTPAPPLPKRPEAWPGGAFVMLNKAKALAAFHSGQSATAGTAAAAVAAAGLSDEP